MIANGSHCPQPNRGLLFVAPASGQSTVPSPASGDDNEKKPQPPGTRRTVAGFLGVKLSCDASCRVEWLHYIKGTSEQSTAVVVRIRGIKCSWKEMQRPHRGVLAGMFPKGPIAAVDVDAASSPEHNPTADFYSNECPIKEETVFP